MYYLIVFQPCIGAILAAWLYGWLSVRPLSSRLKYLNIYWADFSSFFLSFSKFLFVRLSQIQYCHIKQPQLHLVFSANSNNNIST